MALTNPKIFGLNVESKLTDVKNKNIALQNIGINPLDLDIIRGATNEGMTRFDWISFSRLSVPLYKTLDRFNRESNAFSNILSPISLYFRRKSRNRSDSIWKFEY